MQLRHLSELRLAYVPIDLNVDNFTGQWTLNDVHTFKLVNSSSTYPLSDISLQTLSQMLPNVRTIIIRYSRCVSFCFRLVKGAPLTPYL